MEKQWRKGILEAYILYILSKGDTYGYLLLQDINAVTAIAQSTLYPILYRLESNRFLSTYVQEIDGRLRKYYRITPLGQTRMKSDALIMRQMRQMIDIMIGGNENA